VDALFTPASAVSVQCKRGPELHGHLLEQGKIQCSAFALIFSNLWGWSLTIISIFLKVQHIGEARSKALRMETIAAEPKPITSNG